jgi:organic radical activating enzyme
MELKFKNVFIGFQDNQRISGVPSIFLEIGKCNLCCNIYNSGNELLALEPTPCNKCFDIGKITKKQAKEFINKNQQINHVVICGGEPLLYKDELEEFLNDIWRDGLLITIYTNGTLPMLNPLSKNYRVSLYIVTLHKGTLVQEGTRITNTNILTKKKKDIVLGTNDIEQMQYNINYIRDIAIYSNDYIINIAEDFWNTEYNKTCDDCIDEFIDSVEDTDEEFLKNMLVKNPIRDHIAISVVYGPDYATYTDNARLMCLQNGYMLDHNDVQSNCRFDYGKQLKTSYIYSGKNYRL